MRIRTIAYYAGLILMAACLLISIPAFADRNGQLLIWTGAIYVAGTILFVTGYAADMSQLKVYLSEDTLFLSVGETNRLSAEAWFLGKASSGKAAEKLIKWHVSEAAVVSVTSDGLVTGLAPGLARVIAEYGGKKSVCDVVVSRRMSRVSETVFDNIKTSFRSAGYEIFSGVFLDMERYMLAVANQKASEDACDESDALKAARLLEAVSRVDFSAFDDVNHSVLERLGEITDIPQLSPIPHILNKIRKSDFSNPDHIDYFQDMKLLETYKEVSAQIFDTFEKTEVSGQDEAALAGKRHELEKLEWFISALRRFNIEALFEIDYRAALEAWERVWQSEYFFMIIFPYTECAEAWLRKHRKKFLELRILLKQEGRVLKCGEKVSLKLFQKAASEHDGCLYTIKDDEA